MNIRIFVASILLTLVGAVTLSQLGFVPSVGALAPRGGGLTEPITPPITTFTTSVRGNIQYRFLNYKPEQIKVAPGVEVFVTNFPLFDAKKAPQRGGANGWAKTDKNGDYILTWEAEENKTYYIWFWDNKGTTFTPKQYGITFAPQRGGNTPVFNAEGKINYYLILSEMNKAFGANSWEDRYNPRYDADNNYMIDIYDTVRLKNLLLFNLPAGARR
ncbi:hypothetical protein HY404_02335 [Candidatus Microgenomates bacterium]|nr:hypothetical protein [Candidatus Microgenomates bacterium]